MDNRRAVDPESPPSRPPRTDFPPAPTIPNQRNRANHAGFGQDNALHGVVEPPVQTVPHQKAGNEVEDDIDVDPDLLSAVHATMTPYLTCEPVAPAFSAAWFDYADDDPRRFTALIQAALAWWVTVTPGLPEPAEVRRTIDDRIADLVDDLVTDAHLADQARYLRNCELSRERREAAARPRPGDYMGGPLEVWGPTTAARTNVA